MHKLEMRNSLGVMIAILCLAVLPQTAQAAKSGKATQAPAAAIKASPGSKTVNLENAVLGLVQKNDAKNAYDK